MSLKSKGRGSHVYNSPLFQVNLDCSFELFAVVARQIYRDGSYSLEHYDVDLSKEWGYFYQLSGGGGRLPVSVDGVYHRADGLLVEEKPTQLCLCGPDGVDAASTKYLRGVNRTRRLSRLPREFRGEVDILEWLERNGIQDDTVYCSVCDDRLPSENLCCHCWWCDTDGWYVTPTEGKICFDADCRDCSQRRRNKHQEFWRNRRVQRRQALNCLPIPGVGSTEGARV